MAICVFFVETPKIASHLRKSHLRTSDERCNQRKLFCLTWTKICYHGIQEGNKNTKFSQKRMLLIRPGDVFSKRTQNSQVLGLNGSGWESLQVFFVRESRGFLQVPRCHFFIWRLATLRVRVEDWARCWTSCMLGMRDILYAYSYWVFQNVLYKIQNVQHVQHAHHAFKNKKLLFLVSQSSIQVS